MPDDAQFTCDRCRAEVQWTTRTDLRERVVLRGACLCPGAVWVTAVRPDDPMARRAFLAVVDQNPAPMAKPTSGNGDR